MHKSQTFAGFFKRGFIKVADLRKDHIKIAPAFSVYRKCPSERIGNTAHQLKPVTRVIIPLVIAGANNITEIQEC